MKVLILTQPLFHNYGGLLQAYALQETIRRLGFDVITDSPHRFKRFGKLLDWMKFLPRVVKKYLLGHKNTILLLQYYDYVVGKNCRAFVNQNIKVLNYDKNRTAQDFSAFVVGSDQVWRPAYNMGRQQKYFLNFAEGSDVIRLAYAASFGLDSAIEYDEPLLNECSQLLKQFDGVSVREDSGVDICRDSFGVESIHVLDPTMLLECADYDDLIKSDFSSVSVDSLGKLVTYILDASSDKDAFIDNACKSLNSERFEISARRYNGMTVNLKQAQLAPISHWLKSIRDASYVITDSFHGMVFSILFHKPFVVLINESRGAARFISLLKLLGLQSRIASDAQGTLALLQTPINYEVVDEVLRKKREYSLGFLKTYLKKQ